MILWFIRRMWLGHSDVQNMFLICVWSSTILTGSQLPRPWEFAEQWEQWENLLLLYLVSCPQFLKTSKTIEVQWVSCFPNKPLSPQLGLCYWGGFWKTLKNGGHLPHTISMVTTISRRLELSVLPSDFQEGEKGWRLNQSPTANDLITCAYVMKPP